MVAVVFCLLFYAFGWAALCLDAVPVLFCTSVGVLVSFHGSLLLDSSAWNRFVVAEETTMGIFLMFNFIAHILPALGCYAALSELGVEVLLVHGVVATIVHTGWGIYVSYGKQLLSLDHIYIPMCYDHWKVLWGSIILFELILLPTVL